MAKSSPVSVRLDPNLNARISAIAVAFDRPKSWAIEQAVREFVSVQEWQLAAIEEGIRDADEGRVIAHEDVAAWVASWGDPTKPRLPMPRCD